MCECFCPLDSTDGLQLFGARHLSMYAQRLQVHVVVLLDVSAVATEGEISRSCFCLPRRPLVCVCVFSSHLLCRSFKPSRCTSPFGVYYRTARHISRVTQEEVKTGAFLYIVFFVPSSCAACLQIYCEKGSAVSYPYQRCSRSLGILTSFWLFTAILRNLTHFEITST